ncbi:hypothetical protein BN1723_014516 [Verticillium longisporum]|uniref:Alpha-L-rhamnosidase six-hairpin glycosidase domain-containing protein n=1 Tax=Verticillium longisporum TaxID=100787 RepID=A0A0G4M850_VERLO|nr:hypothetical protein BN1708_015763 [Verticillium longisporum]CRK31520.1 hypothetical protein BN1723_014516 [Verticillium longisporum]
MTTKEEQTIVNKLQANWVWSPDWVDSSKSNTVGRIAVFTRRFVADSKPSESLLQLSADTRYKLTVNGTRVAVGPARGSPLIWYYDTIDIAPFAQAGENEIKIEVLRCFSSSRGAMPFERTAIPGLTVVGSVQAGDHSIELDSDQGWEVQTDDSILFPMGLIDDNFLHIYERASPQALGPLATPKPCNIKTLNGELPPWRLRARSIPMPTQEAIKVNTVRFCESTLSADEWARSLSGANPLTLPGASRHVLELQADVHSTAFVRWTFRAASQSQVKLKVTYSEGYELEPRAYPFFRTKAGRLDATAGRIIGPYDEAVLDISAGSQVVYEPFWFRTFRVFRLEVDVGPEAVEFVSLDTMQTHYPLEVKGSWSDHSDPQGAQMWDVSIRTMRNCMFDGYSDCPFYEQLQYSGDTRAVGVFHYLISGDDRLMRQAITTFASSVTAEGLTQSRFPSHVPQIIAAFPLLWILQVYDHHLYFGDTAYARSFIPRIDGVLDFFDRHVDELGLVSGLPEDVWQYVDWVTTWGATDDHPDKGVPTSGRTSNRHTYFSMLYALVLRHAASLLRDVGRPGNATEYEARAASLTKAVRKHCYDGRFFTDSTADVADELAYSQHCQVFAVLSGATEEQEHARILRESFADTRFSKCSYMMQFYALRAFSLAGGEAYETYYGHVWAPWRKMLAANLTTWEEEDVRQRSDCHAWGSVPLYEFCTEVAGVRPLAPGCAKVLFKPWVRLSERIDAAVALGGENVARVSWRNGTEGERFVELTLEKPTVVVSQLPGGDEVNHGMVQHLHLLVE